MSDTLRADKRILTCLAMARRAGGGYRPLSAEVLLAECNLLDSFVRDEAHLQERCRALEERGYVEFRTDGFTQRAKWIITERGATALEDLG